MAAPTSIRLDEPVTRRLGSYVDRHPGATRSSAAARYVDEGLRMDEHPGILFRDGATGRRATVAGGPDVWEVVRAARDARKAEPSLPTAELLTMLEDNTGVPARMITVALDYWGAYPDEVEAFLRHAEQAETDYAAAAQRAAKILDR